MAMHGRREEAAFQADAMEQETGEVVDEQLELPS